LKSKAYGDAPLNVNENVWQAILDRERNGGDLEKEQENLELEDDETDEEMEDEMEDEWGDREFVSDISGDEDDEDLSDLEEVVVRSPYLSRVAQIHFRLSRTMDQRRKTTANPKMAKQNPPSGNANPQPKSQNKDPKRSQKVRFVSYGYPGR
jgi:Mak16 protein C-terminal region